MRRSGWCRPTTSARSRPTTSAQLGEELAPSIEVGWTGRTVVSPTITSAEAKARATTLRRRLLVWDNVPVTDGPMRPMLHLGRIAAATRALPAHVSGLLLNPMAQPRASAMALRTAADYMRAPAAYDAGRRLAGGGGRDRGRGAGGVRAVRRGASVLAVDSRRSRHGGRRR